MGVCCIVFDIDGMLFEFFMNFLNIEQNFFFYFQYFKFSSRFMLFPTLPKKNWCKKKIRVGGGVDFFIFFLDKTTLSDFTIYAIFNIKKIY